MADFVFTSPGVKFKERDLTFVTRSVSATMLGLVGETLKGPAFEPILIQDKGEFSDRFGGQSVKKFSSGNPQYQLPYVANAYLSESDQLYVTRVLGLSGYDAGPAWVLTLSAGADPSTVVTGSSSTSTVAYSNYAYLGVAINALNDTGTYSSGYTKVTTSGFTQYIHTFTATTVNPDGTGNVRDIVTAYSATSYTEYENMVLAVIRSRGYVTDKVNATPVTTFDTTTLSMSGNTTVIDAGDMFGQFIIAATSTASTATYTASLNSSSSNYLPYVIGSEPKDKTTKIWVQAIYPDLIKKLDAEGIGYGINTTVIKCNSSVFTNYRPTYGSAAYQTPETPWVVSQIKGNSITRLFKFISISDGDAANREIKISISNINPITLEFDVTIRDFNDNDTNVSVLESFSKCSLIKGNTNYIAQRIGTSDGEYDLLSKYVMIEMGTDITEDSFPAGFEGYNFNDYSDYDAIAPKIFYKTSYKTTEKVKKTYLGISENGYDSDDDSVVGQSVCQNMFNFNGYGGYINSKGFHMDSGATGTYNTFQFEVGAGEFRTVEDAVDSTNPYYDINTRKFTLVPAGGSDGWDVNRTERTHTDLYRLGAIYDGVLPTGTASNDYQAWETAINTFSNPERVTINVFATPGINWANNTTLVQNTIDMIEEQRTDTLYVIDSPDSSVEPTISDKGRSDVIACEDIVDLLSTTDIDSSYACTYFPWIQIRDTQNNVNLYLPPTGEVVKAFAYTDNVKFPWFAPAGLTRGVTDARKSKYKLSLEARDVLYAGRINPLADFAETGTAIFGQKTLQVKESALDRINVRRLLLRVKVLISNIAVRLLFEQNDQETIDQFISKATPILDTIKRERGLYDFQIKMDDTNNTAETRDRNELYGELFLKPTRSVENIGITFTITPSGASFSDVGA